MKNSEILNQIEKEEYFSALDWSIEHSDFELYEDKKGHEYKFILEA